MRTRQLCLLSAAAGGLSACGGPQSALVVAGHVVTFLIAARSAGVTAPATYHLLRRAKEGATDERIASVFD